MDRKQINNWIESQKNKTSAKDLGDGRRSRSSARIYGLKQVCVLLAKGQQHTLVYIINTRSEASRECRAQKSMVTREMCYEIFNTQMC